jgi:flagellar basal-body rod modification protein FlgD
MTLLLTELQSQDPTAPMDTTAMVGQMVSLNQLDQLMSIQSILQNSLGSGATATTSSTPAVTTAPISNTQATYGVN